MRRAFFLELWIMKIARDSSPHPAKTLNHLVRQCVSLAQLGAPMTVWLWYRKGSFALKEQFNCPQAASVRAAVLVPTVGPVEVFREAGLTSLAMSQLSGAIEVNSFSQRLLLQPIKGGQAARDL